MYMVKYTQRFLTHDPQNTSNIKEKVNLLKLRIFTNTAVYSSKTKVFITVLLITVPMSKGEKTKQFNLLVSLSLT